MTTDLQQRLDALAIAPELWVREEDGTRLYPAPAGGELTTILLISAAALATGYGVHRKMQAASAAKRAAAERARWLRDQADLKASSLQFEALQAFDQYLGGMATVNAWNAKALTEGAHHKAEQLQAKGVRGLGIGYDQADLVKTSGYYDAASAIWDGGMAAYDLTTSAVMDVAQFFAKAGIAYEFGGLGGETDDFGPGGAFSGFKKGTGFSVDPSSIRYGYQPMTAYTTATMKTSGLQQFAAGRAWAW